MRRSRRRGRSPSSARTSASACGSTWRPLGVRGGRRRPDPPFVAASAGVDVLIYVFRSAIAGAAQPAAAEPSVTDLAARTELRAVETLTLTDQQFLTGDKNGKPATIAGELRLPRGAAGKLPAVVLLHGSGGVGPGPEMWAKY